jgi:mannose-1-phosphate guanylyltransferase
LSRVHAVIMAGGRGTRFWPASRESLPKQFLAIASGESLLRRTALRLLPLSGPDRTWVVTNAAHVGIAASHLPEIAPGRIIGEPVGRSTAPCIALAASLIARLEPDATMLAAPADHWIQDEEAFRKTAQIAIDFAQKQPALVTFGIAPAFPETGYGYIEAGDEASPGVHRAVRFLEKPDRENAQKFVESGRHFWNSGIFVWNVRVVREELEKHAPQIFAACEKIAASSGVESAMRESYSALPSISIDYALLERSDRVYVVPARFTWSDIGSWDALSTLMPRDDAENAADGDAIFLDSRGCFVRGGANRLAAVVGMKDVLIVDTPDALLVCPKDRAQEVRKVVEALEKKGRRDLL